MNDAVEALRRHFEPEHIELRRIDRESSEVPFADVMADRSTD